MKTKLLLTYTILLAFLRRLTSGATCVMRNLLGKRGIKIVILFIGAICFIECSLAVPQINNYQGNISDKENITISGSGFGTKAPASPLLWETFDSGNNGDYISQNQNWRAYSGNGAEYSSTNPYGGEGLSAYNYVEYGGDKEFDTNVFYYEPSEEIYYSYMSRYEGTSAWDCVYKNGRINTGTNKYSGDGMIALSGGYIFYRPDSSSVYPDDRRFNSVDIGSNNWQRHQLYGKLSDPPGSTNGLIYAQVHTERKTYENIVSRETGYSFQYGTIILGLMISNLESGDYHHLYVDDVYVDNTQARVEICSGSTWTSRGVCDIQIPYEWSSDSIKVNINQGSFNKDDTAYLFVIDENGEVNPEGYQITISQESSDGNQDYCGNELCESEYRENCSSCPEDCGQCSSVEGFFEDGFESGDLSTIGSDGTNWGSGASTSVSSERANSGEYSLKFTWDGQKNSEQRFRLGSEKDEVYLRYYIYFPSDFEVGDNTPTNNKLVRFWSNEADYSGDPVKIGASYRTRDDGSSYIDPEACVTYSSEANTKILSYNGNTGGAGFAEGLSNVELDDFLGRWVSFEWHFKPDTGAGDGIYEFWIDGVKQFGSASMSFEDAPPMRDFYKTGYLMGWANTGFNKLTEIYIDDVVISDSYIGPIDSDSTPENNCGDGFCDSSGGEDCSSCPGDCLNSGEVCCSGTVYTGDCCSDPDCNQGYDCVNHVCEEVQTTSTTTNVDSTYSGYSKDKINDGVVDAYGMEETTWASAGSSTEPHWVEFVFNETKQITNLSIYWAYNPTQEKFMSSQEVYIQAYDGGYYNLSLIENSDSVETSFKDFDYANTTRLRLWQPADKGYSGYSSVIWLTEVEYGVGPDSSPNSGVIEDPHPADTNQDGVIDFSEMCSYMDLWLNGGIEIDELLNGFNYWKG